MANKFKFDVVLSNFKKNEGAAITEISGYARKYFVSSFDKQGWNGKGWKNVKRRIKGTKEYEYPKKKGLNRRKKPILIGKGTLRRAVNNSVRKKTNESIKFQVDLPYAAIHNEGGIMKNGRRMPKRQFMGWSKELNRDVKQIIKKWMIKAVNTK